MLMQPTQKAVRLIKSLTLHMARSLQWVYSPNYSEPTQIVFIRHALKFMKKPKGKDLKKVRDYLKLVLLTKPPYDYQFDKVINLLLDEFSTIKVLADYIANRSDPYNRESQKNVWESRERNLKFAPEVKKRNEDFFREFWG